MSPGRQLSRKSFSKDGIQIAITVTKTYFYSGAEANGGGPYNSFKTTFNAVMTNSNSSAAQFQFWVDAVFSNGRTLLLNDGHGGLNPGQSVEKYLGSFDDADLTQWGPFTMKVEKK